MRPLRAVQALGPSPGRVMIPLVKRQANRLLNSSSRASVASLGDRGSRRWSFSSQESFCLSVPDFVRGRWSGGEGFGLDSARVGLVAAGVRVQVMTHSIRVLKKGFLSLPVSNGNISLIVLDG